MTLKIYKALLTLPPSLSVTMADVATPSAAPVVDEKKKFEKPEKPDEAAYKAALKKAEKEHADSMAKFVSSPCFTNLRLAPRDTT